MDSTNKSIAFDVDLTSHESRGTKRLPKRLNDKCKTKRTSKEELEEKQEEAERRRKAYEKAKLDRIRKVNDECMKIDSKVQRLLAQDAKRKGLPGTENIKAMSTREASVSLKSLSKDFAKISHVADIGIPNG